MRRPESLSRIEAGVVFRTRLSTDRASARSGRRPSAEDTMRWRRQTGPRCCDNCLMRRARKLLPAVALAAACLVGFALATLRDIRASDPAVQGAIVGALAVVAGGLVGSAVGAWGTLATDERRWAHDDQLRRQQLGFEAARKVRKELLAATKLFSHESAADRFKSLPEPERERRHDWMEPPSDEEVERHTERALDLATEIHEASVRRVVRLAASDLEQWDTAEGWGAGPWSEFCPRIGAELDEYLSAYVRADTLPPTPVVEEVAGFVKDYWATLRQGAPRPEEGDEVDAEAKPAVGRAKAPHKSARPSKG